MVDFIEYVVSELKSKRLSKTDSLALIKQYSLNSSAGAKASALHPLLHINTSDLNQQSYSSTFSGEEFFLTDHQVEQQKVLPAAAYLEMARAAAACAIPAQSEPTALELRNMVWAQPIVVTERKQVTIALLASEVEADGNERIDCEIYSTEEDIEIIHCQGQIVFSTKTAPARLDIEGLKGQMGQGALEAEKLYAAFNKTWVHFGPAHQAITAIYQGERQLLAQLRLPTVVEAGQSDYVLHPSLMDGALQAAIGLVVDLNRLSDQPSLPFPFSLDALRIVSGCTKEMFAWVRYTQVSRPEDRIVKLDIDLCDREGNICVQMRGLSTRTPAVKTGTAEAQDKKTGNLIAAPVWQPGTIAAAANTGKSEYTQRQIILCEMPLVNIKRLEASVPHSHCLQLNLQQQAQPKTIAERYSEYALSCFSVIQKILKDKPQGHVLIQIVIANRQEESVFAGLSGLLKTAEMENPRLCGQIILTDPEITAGELEAQLRENETAPLNAFVKYQQGTRQVLRWQPIHTSGNDHAGRSEPNVAFKDGGVYLITGGLGGLGVVFAKEVLRQTVRAKVILTGRSTLTEKEQNEKKRTLLAELSAGADQLDYRQLDLGNPDEVTQLIATIRKEYHRINGIIHSAGMISDNFILKKTAAEFGRVLAPKVTGTFHLDQASKDMDLDFFILFSSVASWSGNLGQADYAAANGFMDQFAVYRSQLAAAGRRYGKTLSVNWPLWREGGMSVDRESSAMLRQSTGMQPMQTSTGVQAFYRSLSSHYSQTLVMEGDLQQICSRLLMDKPIQSPYAPIPEQTQQVPGSDVNPAGNTAGLDHNALVEKTQDYLCKQFSELFKLPPHKIDPRAPLEKYGIDSILAMKLTNQLEETFGSLSKTLFFEYQNIRELTDYFIKSHAARLASLFAKVNADNGGIETGTTLPESLPQTQIRSRSGRRFSRQRQIVPAADSTSSTAVQNAINTDPIAIIGLSGRYPEAADIEAYWHNLRDGKDCIVEVPKERWDWRQYYSEDRTQSGCHYSKWGGFIDGVDQFDPRLFNISPREASSIDPQERLFLQHAWMAVEDAGYTRSTLQIPHGQGLAGQVGVYVGVMFGEYNLSGSLASIANRVSYVLNLHGPSMTLDTMCSSSLTAIHIACQDLKQGRTDMAIAGGVNISIHPNKYLVLSAGQFISSDGHCQSFGEGGDGYIPGEGVGVVILKRLSEAQKAGDPIYGIISGSALNHGGKTNGYTVPNPQAQASVISQALAESNTDPRHISYIEAHGTGTRLGDPIEIAALSKAYRAHTGNTGFCLIGSAKSNIGHCESAAGIAGLTKVLLQLQHRQIVPSLHSARLNPHIDFENSPFVVNQTLRAWDQPVMDGKPYPRIAGISSFGAGGANAHLIVEEYIPPAEVEQPVSVDRNTGVIIPLSARTEEQLQQKARDLLNFIGKREVDLPAMAYTLQVGREAMDERLGFIVGSVEQLAEKLQAYIDGGQDIEDAYRGQVNRNRDALTLFSTDADFAETIDKWIAHKKLSRLLDSWVRGLELDWNRLYSENKPARISLPTYPFAKERYWKEVAADGQPVTGISLTALHPLLHSNTSDLSQQSYSSVFSGEEFFLKDHQVDLDGWRGAEPAAQRILPAAACLEMARAAVEKASPTRPEAGILELRNTVWGEPVVAAKNRQITIALRAKDNQQVDYEIYGQDGEAEIIHCQGRALFSHQPAPAKLDIARLKEQMGQGRLDADNLYPGFADRGLHYGPAYRAVRVIYQGSGQLLAELSLPGAVENNQGDYILHPSLMDSALQASIGLTGDPACGTRPSVPELPSLPFALESLRVIFACTKDMFAWVRYSRGSQPDDSLVSLDIDLCDPQGNVCVQMRGISYRRKPLEVIRPQQKDTTADLPTPAMQKTYTAPATVEQISITAATAKNLTPRKLPFDQRKQTTFTQVALEKPKSIVLAVPGELILKKSGASAKTANVKPVVLSSTTFEFSPEGGREEEYSPVSLYELGNGVFSIRVSSIESENTLSKKMIEKMLQAIGRVQEEPSVKVLMLSGTEHCFLRGGRNACNEAVELKLYETIASFPYPVVAAMQGGAAGAGFLVGALCDFMICSQESEYYYTDVREGLYPSAREAVLFKARFGEIRAQDFLYQSGVCTGRQLQEKGWNCPILPQTEVEAYAEKLAANLAGKPQGSLRLLKLHLARQFRNAACELTCVDPLSLTDENPSDTTGTSGKVTSPSQYIQLEVPAAKVLLIRICVPGSKVTRKAKKRNGLKALIKDLTGSKQQYGLTELLADLTDIFSQAEKARQYKCIVIASDYPEFLPEASQGTRDSVMEGFQRLVLDARLPVIAALNSNAKGMAWFISQLCDACIYNEKGRYSAASFRQIPGLAKQAATVFALRFGNSFGKEILLTGAEYVGSELRQCLGTLKAAEQDRVLPAAIELAGFWTRLPLDTLVSWKREMALRVWEKMNNLSVWLEPSALSGREPSALIDKEPSALSGREPSALIDKEPSALFDNEPSARETDIADHAPTPIALDSKVVTATAYPQGILMVKMEDREAKNMFSEALIQGVMEVFQHIEQTPTYKVVILTGYDHYFASGGTREDLLAIQEGRARFTDRKIYQLAMDCKVPVIAAMQGHGIGAGWALGMFADFTLFSEESKYVSPYMSYGFTPGAGATFIFPEKVGYDLATETLLTGQEISGSELKGRGLSNPVLPRQQVVTAALALARQIAQGSRSGLIAVKQQLTQHLYSPLEETYKLELAMHDHTFVGRSEIVKQIQTNFIQAGGDSPASQPSLETEPTAEPNHTAVAHPAPEADSLPAVTATLKKLLAHELHMQEGELDENAQFVDLGLDSITGVTWIRKINEEYGTSIEATKVYSYSTLAQLSQYVKEQVQKQSTQVGESPVSTAVGNPAKAENGNPSRNETGALLTVKKLSSWRKQASPRMGLGKGSIYPLQPIAVIGMAGKFPKANNLEAFWQNIAQGNNCVSQVARERWDMDTWYQEGGAVPGKTYSKWMGALEEYDCFDPLFFNISPKEARNIDPQQRVFLQACWHSIENAGYNAEALSGSKCGVFAGCGVGDYHHLSREHQLSAQGFTGGAPSILAARISYLLNLQGPCLSIDTACSSSLVAIASACDSLISGGSDIALAGGVCVMSTPEMHIMTSQSGMLSPDGRCFTFDQRANGIVLGEGVGVVMLKRLADAERDRDIIAGVIQGWGVNQDGKTNGITAPNPEAQTRLQQEVYDKYGIDPANTQLIETHGTGTKLGDPIEIAALKESFKKYTRKQGYCALGSVKSNIGHCLAAAGASGFIKLMLALKHRQLPPTINCEQVNEHISLTDSPFYINRQLREWELKGAQRRQAAISSFGFSGTNAHIVIAEYLPSVNADWPVRVVCENGGVIIPLSARTPEQLRQKAQELLDFIRQEEQSKASPASKTIDLTAMAYTLQTGRVEMEERLGFMVASADQLTEKLQAYINGEQNSKDVYQGQVKRNKEGLSIISQDDDMKEAIIDQWIARGKMSKLLELWVKGLALDWNKLYGEIKPERINLPGYPFAKERYWIDTANTAAGADSVAAQEQGSTTGRLLVTPVWQPGAIAASDKANRLVFAQHHIILCEMPNVQAERLKALLEGPHKGHCDCVSLTAQDQENIAARYSRYALTCFEHVRKIIAGKPQRKALVQMVVPNNREQAILAGLSGLMKTAAMENPNIIGQTILAEPQTGTDELVKQLQNDQAGAGDAVIKYEQGARYIRTWKTLREVREKPSVPFKNRGVYLITGGLGGLGVLFAKEILKQADNARIILTGRSVLSEKEQHAKKQAILEGFSAGADQLDYRPLDIDNPGRVEKLIARIKAEYQQLNGIIHCAGMISDNLILKKTSAEFSRVLAPKVTGTLNLDRASKDIDLDFLVLFSSIASGMGNPGQADYATANGFMDQFAAYRNHLVAAGQRRGKTMAFNWPLWEEGGMSVDKATRDAVYQSTGIRPMRTPTGMQVFYQSLASPYDQTMVLEGNLPQLQRTLFAEQANRPAQPLARQPGVAGPDTVDPGIVAIDKKSLGEKTESYLCKQFADLLELPVDKIDPREPLETYGINSILVMSLTSQLERTFGRLSKTLFYEYQTIGELAGYLIESFPARLAGLFSSEGIRTPAAADNSNHQAVSHNPLPEHQPAAGTQPVPNEGFSRGHRNSGLTVNTDPIAIIGLSGRYPQAENLREYWQNLSKGKDCITEVPKNRWDWQEYYSEDRTKSGHHYSKWGGFITGVDEFDPLFFNISPADAAVTDPQERLFLQHTWMAVEDAGYTRASLQIPAGQYQAGQVGVYVGVTYSEYQLFGAEASVRGKRVGFAGSLASIANRVSYVFNLHGPSMTLDTMCSSSLTAIHLACQDLKLGRTDLAIAGGVNVLIHPNKYLMLSAGQFISGEGRCQSFGEGGDGYIPGEGVGVAILKRLSDAERDGDHIYGLIRGSAINHGGKTNGYTVPNPNAQACAISRALAESGTDPRHISYIEAHGTGTRLGDPIEITALCKAFQHYTGATGFCFIGSAKSNVGHCESAAGISGLTKVLMQMQHRQLVPSLHSTRLNPHIDFGGSPFVVNQTLRAWERPLIDGRQLPRVAGISSFGAGGSNAHIIVEEYQPPEAVKPLAANSGVIIPLSARTPVQLRQKARDLLDCIRAANEQAAAAHQPLDLLAMAYTLQVGREAMEERLGFVVDSIEQLAEKIQAYIDGGRDLADVYQGQVKNNNESLSLIIRDDDIKGVIEKWITENKLSKLLDLWVKGLELDWHRLYAGGRYAAHRPRRISLPTYPFAQDRYWIDTEPALPTATAAVLHPLLHTNTSNFSQQSYRSTFSGTEFFLRDHRVHGRKVLPPVAYLEMARAAVEQASAERQDSNTLELYNIVWVQPFVAATNRSVTIALMPKGDRQIDYEIYSTEVDGCQEAQSGVSESLPDIIHCRGKALFGCRPIPARLDIGKLQGQMQKGELKSGDLYNDYSSVGIDYGASYQGVATIYRGTRQLLARLRLPVTAEAGAKNYRLHPVLLDSALQSAVALCAGSNQRLARSPFALESLSILSACSKEMYAWVRPSQDNGSEGKACTYQAIVKLDIDLVDQEGNICVQMQGLSFENKERDLEYLLQTTGKSWLSVTESWVLSPLEVDTALWSNKIEAKKEHSILIISKDKNDYDTVKTFCREIAKVANNRGDLWEIRYLSIQADENANIEAENIKVYLADTRRPQTIFLFLPKAVDNGMASRGTQLVYTCIQSLMQAAATQRVQFYCCYPDQLSEHSLHREGLAGLFKSAMLENPHHRYRSISYGDQLVSEGKLALRVIEEWLCDETTSLKAERVPMVRLSNGNRFELQVNEMAEHKPLVQPAAFREGATYLMVGALGEAGELVCQELGRRYKARLVIFSRRGGNEVEEKLKRIEKAGASVIYRSVDILDLDALTEAMQSLKNEGVVIHGVVHMARRVADAPIIKKRYQDFSETLSAKVAGTLNIDAVTANEPLEFFLIYSSMAAFGIKGSPDYAYSTAFQNAFTRYRNCLLEQNKRSGRCLAICWGQWELDGGVDPEKMPARLSAMRQQGLDFIDARSAITVMEASLSNQSEVAGFIAVSDREKVLEIMDFEQNSSMNKNRIFTTIEAFERGEICKRKFIEFLNTLTDQDYSGPARHRIIRAIRQYDRKSNRRFEAASSVPVINFNTTFKSQPAVISQPKPGVNKEAEVRNQEPVSARVIRNLTNVLGLKDAELDADKSFQDYGLDSISAAQLSAVLEKDFAFSIPPSWLVEFPTINTLTVRLNQEIEAAEPV